MTVRPGPKPETHVLPKLALPKLAAQRIWFELAPELRSYGEVSRRLAEMGLKASKSTVHRWSEEWVKEPRPAPAAPQRDPVAATAERFLPVPAASDVDLGNIPQELRDVLDPRLSLVLRTRGLDRLENAVAEVADAIAKNAGEIAKNLMEPETEVSVEQEAGEDGKKTSKRVQKAQVARNAVTALATLASAMQTITASRTMVSLAHRNFGEGDKLMAEGKAIYDDTRANRATDVTDQGQVIDGEAESEALDALRGQALGK